MASIATSVELYDKVSQPLQLIVSALHATVTAFASVNTAMDSGMDTAAINNATSAIEEAVNEVNNLQAAIQNVNSQMVEPVQVPVNWETDNFEVFTNTGVERFEQEMASANQMIQTLIQNQHTISQTASTITLLPASAQSDISNITNRISGLQQRLQVLESTPVSMQTTEVNNQIEQIRSQLDSAISAQNELNSALDDMDAEAANRAYMRLSQTVSGTERYIRDNTDEQGHFNQSIQQGATNASKLSSLIGKAAGALGAFFSIRKIIDFSNDSMELFNTQLNSETQLMTVLANMVDDDYVLEVMAEDETSSAVEDFNALQDSINNITATITLEAKTAAVEKEFEALTSKASEIQSKGIYGDEAMIAGAAELSTYFTDTDAVEMMMDTLSNYAMGMSGGGALDSTQMTDYATGLGKIMSGAYDAMTKKGFEFTDSQKAVIEGTATEAEYIAVLGEQYTSMSDDMRAATAITQVVNESWGGLYETMSNTPEGKIIQLNNAWGDMKEVIGSQLYPHVIKLVDVVQNNWGTIQSIVQGVTKGIGFILGLVGSLIQGVINVGAFFQENWSVIAPIIMGIVTALGAYLIVAGIVNTINGVMATIEDVKAAAQMMSAGATFAETVAQQGLNAALAACPLTWIIVLIIALIAIIYAVCQAIATATGVANSGFGVICGGIMVVIAFFKNLGLTIANFAIAVWNSIKNVGQWFANLGQSIWAIIQNVGYGIANFCMGIVESVKAIVNNIGIAFNNAWVWVQSTFWGLVDSIMQGLKSVAEFANSCLGWLGVNIDTSSFDFAKQKVEELNEQYQEFEDVGEAWNRGNSTFEYADIGAAWEDNPIDWAGAWEDGMNTFDTFQDGWADEAFQSGAAWGDGVADTISSAIDGFGDMLNGGQVDAYGIDTSGIMGTVSNYDAANLPSNVSDIAENTSDALDITDEELKYLHDIAERDTINRFTTAEVSVNFGGITQNVNSDSDLDGIIDYFASGLQEALETTAEGVHA